VKKFSGGEEHSAPRGWIRRLLRFASAAGAGNASRREVQHGRLGGRFLADTCWYALPVARQEEAADADVFPYRPARPSQLAHVALRSEPAWSPGTRPRR